MAKARKTTETKTVMKPVEEKVETITLTLSATEARALRDILANVGGSSREVDAMREAMTDAGVPFRYTKGILSGSIYFEAP
jgi:hypothetical protein